MDLSPLRTSPHYRRLWSGNVFAFLGTQMTLVAAAVEVFQLTRSSLAVGLLALASLVPLLSLGLVAGAIGDAVDRRVLCLVSSAGLVLVAVGLWSQSALAGGNLPAIYALVAAQSALAAFDQPTRRLFVPRLVAREQLPAANALFSLEANAGHILGPLAAGALIATAGLSWAYLADAAGTAISIYAVLRLPAMRPEGGGTRPSARSIAEGLRHLRSDRVLHASFLADMAATILAMPRALFPELAIEHLEQGPGFVGVLHAAPAVGALIGALTSGWLTAVRRQGAVLLWAVTGWGLAIATFGLVGHAALSLALLACAGLADMISATLRATILQQRVADELQGRLMGAYFVVVGGSPRLGNVQAGALGSAIGPAPAVVVGGLTCLAAVAALAWRRPELRAYSPRRPPSAQDNLPEA